MFFDVSNEELVRLRYTQLIIKLDSIIKLVKICFWCFEKGTLENYSGVPFDFNLGKFYRRFTDFFIF